MDIASEVNLLMDLTRERSQGNVTAKLSHKKHKESGNCKGEIIANWLSCSQYGEDGASASQSGAPLALRPSEKTPMRESVLPPLWDTPRTRFLQHATRLTHLVRVAGVHSRKSRVHGVRGPRLCASVVTLTSERVDTVAGR